MAATPALPPLAAKVDDLESLKKTVEDAASVGAALWFSYIFVLFYIAIATGGVTHIDLLLERSVKLPFLNVELPLTAFFFLAPIIFVIVHVYVLTHFVLLGRKAKRFHEELLIQIPGRDKSDQDAAKKRDKLRGQLPSNVFVQFLAGPRDVRDGAFGVLLRAIAYVTLVFGPLALLLLLQLQFLPYHNIFITWVQRIAFVLDLGLIWWLWRDIVSGRGDYKRWFQWTKWGMPLLGSFASCFLIVFSIFVTTLPDETMPAGPAWFPAKWFWCFWKGNLDDNDSKKLVTLHDGLFAGPIDHVSGHRKSLFSNTLVLPAFDLYSELKIKKSEILDENKRSINLRGRNLQGAIFDLADLSNADFTGTNLQESSFFGANVQGATFYNAELHYSNLRAAIFNNSTLIFADMRGVNVQDTMFLGAILDGANLQETRFFTTHFQGAKIRNTSLQHTVFFNVDLQSADLEASSLQGANITRANLQGASLKRANLQAAVLSNTNLQGATLENANLQGASLYDTKLQGTSLYSADLRSSVFFNTHLEGALADRSNLQGADLKNSYLDTTKFSEALTWRSKLPEKGSIFIERELEWRPIIYDSGIKPWTNVSYNEFRDILIAQIPDNDQRKWILERIKRLDCSINDLPPCSNELEKVQKPKELAKFEYLSVDSEDYASMLATVLAKLVCNNDANSIFVLRGLLSNGVALNASSNFIKNFQNDNLCPLASKLTDDDREKLKQAELSAKDSK